MNLSKFWYVLSVFSIAGLIWLTGYFIGNRVWVIEQPDNVSIVGSNNARINSLNNIHFQFLKARIDNNNVVNVGEMMMYETGENKTDIMIRIHSLPVSFNDNANLIPFAKEYDILLAKTTQNGLNYNVENLGKIALNEPKDGQYSGSFFTSLEFSLVKFKNKFDRIIFVNSEAKKLPPYDNPIFPSEYRKNPSPFIWSE